jgi:hypothetical protein
MGRLLWQERQDIGPAPRATALAYVSSKARTLLFGGVSYVAPWYFGDTWEWDGEGWVQVADTGPDARAGAKLSYDSDRNVTSCLVDTGKQVSISSIRGSGMARRGRRLRTKGPRRQDG